MRWLWLIAFIALSQAGFCVNQTKALSPISDASKVPFSITVEQAEFSLPNGIHSFASAIYDDRWIFLGGSTNGLSHEQNALVYVVDPVSGTTITRSLSDPTSGLTQSQIDTLAVISPQSLQSGNTLYIAGGYGFDTASGTYNTKDTLTAVYLPGLMHWAANPYPGETAAQHIRQIYHPVFQVTGGQMVQGNHGMTLLIFGQKVTGLSSDPANSEYTKQVRHLRIIDDGIKLDVEVKDSALERPCSAYRRRDFNVVPVIKDSLQEYVAFSGIFTVSGGAWTVPVTISQEGQATMAKPKAEKTFKQGMNNYSCPTLGLRSSMNGNMYILFFGGLSFGFFQQGEFKTDSALPFTNQITAVRMTERGYFSQYLMDAEYPTILSSQSNPGNPLFFGAAAKFLPAGHLPMFDNGVLKLERLGKKPVVVGYIVGGLQSSLPTTCSTSDFAASPYVFRVILHRKS